MKLSFAIAVSALAGTTSAFAPSSPMAASPASITALRMSEEPTAAEDAAPIMIEEPVTPSLPSKSQSMPFMARPVALDGSLAGDVGFDPLGFAKTKEDLLNYREAETKHARLAMLAAAGWPLSEVFDKKIAATLNMPAVVDATDRAPSLLNGGLGKVNPAYWVACLVLAGAVDVFGIMRSKGGDYATPGDLGFDPLGVYPKSEDGKKWMETAEIKNGRLAMIAIFAFAIQEAVSKVGVVDETPFFFFPIFQSLKDYANSGYIN
jgi:hypothetical protein